MMNVLQSFLFPPPPSIFVTAMSFISFGSLANAGLSELRGKHLQYSKFVNWNVPNKIQQKQIIISSKVGMAFLYTPAFLFGVASFFIFPDEGFRFLLLRSALTIHFLKRVLEVLFVHRFGGSGVALHAAIPIALSYFISTVTMIYAQHLSGQLPEPSIDLTYPGVGLFLLGIGGNLYHHYILATLRGEGEKEYKIPKGGLFDLVLCPHYLFEVLGFVGISCIAQTPYTLAFTAGTTLYLLGRSCSTKKWYMSKFEDFPKDAKVFLPFIF
ncbi:very-long-chain enoyl-CoA reductase-like [Chenopodium quinoa]|uniref:very-long-chain enoyl-CoA reductase-like n=1 Tax=Chenopodium quinoa TaxID=63459 RepID=UPI000B7794FB|nr:very-long-chain enoyl-CoA reductase-like [Chenopodium quinoa]